MIELTSEFFFDRVKKRDQNTHKGSYGTLTAVCGSSLFRGAPALAAIGALRTGCGIVRVASTEKVIASLSAKLDECIYLPLKENEAGGISQLSTDAILEASKNSTALLVGCGMTCLPDTKSIVTAILARTEKNIVLDADALNSISASPDALLFGNGTVTLTPHIGEMARLYKGAVGREISFEEIKSDPVKYASELAYKYKCTVVLKDHVTHIVSYDQRTAKNSNGNAGLARGGSGDILSGMIASFNAQGFDPFDSACLGVWLHAEAADICARERSQIGMLPSDIPEYICRILSEAGR